jgi:hypothetical protein
LNDRGKYSKSGIKRKRKIMASNFMSSTPLPRRELKRQVTLFIEY